MVALPMVLTPFAALQSMMMCLTLLVKDPHGAAEKKRIPSSPDTAYEMLP